MVERGTDFWETPTIEVRVFRHGELVATERCESEADAAAAVERWSDELEGVTCEVDDLTVRHEPDDVLAPEPALDLDEGEPRP